MRIVAPGTADLSLCSSRLRSVVPRESVPPESATADEATRRSDLEQRFAYVTQAFESAQRTMRYACNVPIALEARLGRYAQALKEHL